MRCTTTTALLAVLLLAGGATACSDNKSYEEITADCAATIKDQPEGDTSKPDECDGVNEDDYKVLRISQGLEDSGVVKDGEVNMDKLLDDATTTP
ncbi:hypothetical protein SUDANB108_07113 [Streptomyces sp. enrichment culture]|uniref:hypothetical protein n=1 Tax=Streptomyces sp. enrichment culture TaxID=1795815 RepID=UPI003F554E3D